LQIQVGAETLSPRTRLQSSPSALNAAALGGFDKSYYLNTSSLSQDKSGTLSATLSDPNNPSSITWGSLADSSVGFGGGAGVIGRADLTNGVGVLGSGESYGVYGSSIDGYGGYFGSLNDTGVYGQGHLVGGGFHSSTGNGTGVYADGGVY